MTEQAPSTHLTVEFIQRSILSGDYELSIHADNERLADELTMKQIESALIDCEMIEEYPNDPRGASCLVLGHSNDQPIHVVCGRTRQEKLILITVYIPTQPKWLDPRTRNP